MIFRVCQNTVQCQCSPQVPLAVAPYAITVGLTLQWKGTEQMCSQTPLKLIPTQGEPWVFYNVYTCM